MSKRRRDDDDDGPPEAPEMAPPEPPEDDADDEDGVGGADNDDDDDDDDDVLAGVDVAPPTRDADMARAANRVWLMKVPEWLYRHWTSCPDDAAELGSVILLPSTDPNQQAEVKLNLADTPFNRGKPKDFVLKMQTESDGVSRDRQFSTYAFSDYSNQIAVEGTVDYKFSIEPVKTEEYRRFIHEQVEKELKPDSTIELTTSRQEVLKPLRMTAAEVRRSKELFYEKRHERLPKETVVQMIFQCFHKHKYWNLKGLKEHTKQPEVYLKEILSEMCVFNRSGKHMMLYQLKPELVANINAPETSNLENDMML